MERVCAKLVTAVVSIVLARVLFPDDYSVISIVTIFFTFCDVFITGGLNSALIQKKNADTLDFSTIFIANTTMATVLYLVMFFCAPLIAALFQKELLVPVIRVMGLTFFVNAYKAVLSAKVSSDLQFRKFFWSTFIGTVISAFVGVTMALMGFGPWALVAQQMTNSCIDTLVLSFTAHLKLRPAFSFSRFKGLFNYGGKIMLASLITAVYEQVKPLIVGIKYTPTDLAFYNKGATFPNLISSLSSDTLSASLFPAMSKVQDDKAAILAFTRRFMQLASFVTFPLMLGFLAISENFVRIVLTDKWLPIVPYIMIFCVSTMLKPVQHGNLQAIRAIGRSDIVLILEIIKKSSYAVIIALFVIFTDTPILLAVSGIVTSLLASLINTFPNRKLIGYSYRKQFSDLLLNFITSAVMCGAVYAMNFLPLNLYLLFFLQIVAGFAVYIGLNALLKNKSLFYLLDSAKGVLKKHGKRSESM